MSISTPALAPSDAEFVQSVEDAFRNANTEFARSYYLFATARLEKTYDSASIYAKYPLIHDEATFTRLKGLYEANPQNESIKRLFVDAFGTYIGNKFAAESDDLTNEKNKLEIDVSGLELTDKDGQPLDKVLYEDTSELFKTLPDKVRREALYKRVSDAYVTTITPKFIDLFNKENALFAELGYPDIIGFYSQSSGHNLKKLGEKAKTLLDETEAGYTPRVAEFYKKRTDKDFALATRADISFVFHGKSDEMAGIDTKFPESQLLPLAKKTFDGMGLNFSDIAESVDYSDKTAYTSHVESEDRATRILLDVTNREGKRSRAYVYPARVPNEVYLSVKPEGGLDDYSAFFHESGHAQHFAYVDGSLSYPLALMGNNSTTEGYAYLFQNLFLNKHWLVNIAGLTEDEAVKAIKRSALNDLYMLRRYASKMRFELALYDGSGLDGKSAVYAQYLSEGTGFKYDEDGWSRDVDAGFYVADYFTAWALEAQLREYLQTHFGSYETQGEDWYQNPEAGEFLKGLWAKGNLTQDQLSAELEYNDPTDVNPLMRLMVLNIDRKKAM